MGKDDTFNAELFFAALADKTRLRLLNLMRDGEVCVCFFAGTLATNNPKISRHLSYLKRAGLVTGRRDGKWIHYRINEPADKTAREVFAATMKMLDADTQMKADRKRLTNICCDPQLVNIRTG
jgi:ArsR family transcriptional regulator